MRTRRQVSTRGHAVVLSVAAVAGVLSTNLSPAAGLDEVFGPASAVAVGTEPQFVAVGDVNGDGKPDLVVANTQSSNVSVRRGAGNGTFTSPFPSEIPVPGGPLAVALADFNGDGKVDLAVATDMNGVSVRLGAGNGTFPTVAASISVRLRPRSVAVGDFNGDGKADLAVANRDSNDVSVRLGAGDGTFTSPGTPEVTVGSSPRSVAVADFNGDGKADLAVANGDSNNVSVRLGAGNGLFTAPAPAEIAVAVGPRYVAVADFNGDGKADLAVPAHNMSAVSVRLGAGDGTFTSPAQSEVLVNSDPVSLAVGDFNGDGNADFVTANFGSNSISLRVGAGDGTFSQPAVAGYGVGLNPSSVAVADFNGDGLPDVVTANTFSGNASILLNKAKVLASISVTPANGSVARGGSQQFTAIGTFVDGAEHDLTGSVTWDSSGPAAAINSAGLATGQQAGSTTISATSGGISGSTTLAVTPTNLVVHGPAISKAYGDAVPALPASYVGLLFSDSAPATPAGCTTSATAASPAGSYVVSCSGASDPNYVMSYAAGTLVVNPVALTVQAPSLSKPYGASVPALAPSYLGLANGDTGPATAASCTTAATAASPAGSYPVTCSGAASPSYTISYAAGTLTVTKAELTVQGPAATKTYGAAVSTLPPTYVGLTNDDATPSTPATCTTTATASSPVGSYPVTCSGAADPNYVISYSPGSLLVQGAELVVRGPTVSKVYGAPVQVLSPSYVGLIGGDTGPATAATCASAATASSDAGSYAVRCSGAADPNYVIVYADGTLTVTRAPLTVQAPSVSKTYGTAVPALVPSYVGLVSGDAVPDTAATCSTSATLSSNVNTYAVTCSGAADGNYDVSYAAGTLTITKAALTVSADNQTRGYGQANPPLTVSYSGFVLGQTRQTSDLAGSPSCTTAAGPTSTPGGYAITCTAGTLSSTNYGFSFDPGTLTVGKAATALTARPISVVRSLLAVSATMSANLRSDVTTQPAVGERVNFTLGNRTCSATTDAAGNASCSVSIVTAILNARYTATYAGSVTYLPSSDTATVTLL